MIRTGKKFDAEPRRSSSGARSGFARYCDAIGDPSSAALWYHFRALATSGSIAITPRRRNTSVECFAERQCSFRAARLGGASKQQSRGHQIAMGDEILATLDERGNLVGVK
jgi:hypothetical protein